MRNWLRGIAAAGAIYASTMTAGAFTVNTGETWKIDFGNAFMHVSGIFTDLTGPPDFQPSTLTFTTDVRYFVDQPCVGDCGFRFFGDAGGPSVDEGISYIILSLIQGSYEIDVSFGNRLHCPCFNRAFSITRLVPAVPLPAALPLMGIGVGALGLLKWHQKRRAKITTAFRSP